MSTMTEYTGPTASVSGPLTNDAARRRQASIIMMGVTNTPGSKSHFVAYFLLMIGGLLGFHRLYLHKYGTAILWACTLGLFGLGFLWDIFTLGVQVDEYNDRLYGQIYDDEQDGHN